MTPRRGPAVVVLVLGAGLTVAAMSLYADMAHRFGPPFAGPMGIVGLITGAIILRGPVGKSIAGMLSGDGGEASPELLAELDDLRQRVADAEALHVRMAELEERIDFSERLLARHAGDTSPADRGGLG